jgi:hypothetical protein
MPSIKLIRDAQVGTDVTQVVQPLDVSPYVRWFIVIFAFLWIVWIVLHPSYPGRCIASNPVRHRTPPSRQDQTDPRLQSQ